MVRPAVMSVRLSEEVDRQIVLIAVIGNTALRPVELALDFDSKPTDSSGNCHAHVEALEEGNSVAGIHDGRKASGSGEVGIRSSAHSPSRGCTSRLLAHACFSVSEDCPGSVSASLEARSEWRGWSEMAHAGRCQRCYV